MSELLERAKARCDASELTYKPVSYNLGDQVEGGEAQTVEGLVVQIPEEREFKSIVLLDTKELSLLDNTEFEKYRFLKGYEAIWSEDLRVVECEIQAEGLLRVDSLLFKRLGSALSGGAPNDQPPTLTLPSPHPEVEITIGKSSPDFTFFSSFERASFFSPAGRLIERLTLRIKGVKVHTHADALRTLNSIGASILFQIDLVTNVPVHFAIDRNLTRELRAGRGRTLSKGITLTPPKYQYDEEAISLYWYARTAQSMPLLQYLAFYQVIEFYFPVYSYADAQHRIRNFLKDPTFDANNDGDISQILNVIRVSGKGKSFGDERAQLRATIISCVDNASLWGYFNADEDRKRFFDVQQKSKSLAKQKISFSNPENDLRNEVASRIYELRCRIVHTKDENEYELILPFSPELAYLKYDLLLIEYIAKLVLVASGRPLQLDV